MSTASEPPLRAELRIHTICLSILTVVAVGLTLLWLRTVLIPFVVAVFLAIAFMPLVDILEIRAHLSRTIASCVVLILACLVLAGLLAHHFDRRLSNGQHGYAVPKHNRGIH